MTRWKVRVAARTDYYVGGDPERRMVYAPSGRPVAQACSHTDAVAIAAALTGVRGMADEVQAQRRDLADLRERLQGEDGDAASLTAALRDLADLRERLQGADGDAASLTAALRDLADEAGAYVEPGAERASLPVSRLRTAVRHARKLLRGGGRG